MAWIATGAAVLAGLTSTAPASADVIGFDDQPAGTIVNAQYASQGVTFNDVRVVAYPGGFAHSSPNGVEQCIGVEFCTAPARVDFTAGQDSVRVWVGASYSLANSETVELKAFDADSNLVATDAAVLPANPGSTTPIQTELALDPPGATIRRIEVAYQAGGSGGIAIDDVEFSSAGPPPTCNATAVPTVRLDLPADSSVQNNAFRLSGAAQNNGAPITSATIVAENGTPLTGQMYPSLIDGDGGNFGPVSYHGLLRAGTNEVRVNATNCAGTGTSTPITLNFNPIPPSTQFHQLGMVEITQGIQNHQNSIPLLAATPNSSKRTFARVYLKLENGAAAIENVTGRLVASRPDGSLPGGPVGVQSLNSINVAAGATVEDVRANDLVRSLNFELPEEWLRAGRLHVELDRLNIEGAQTSLQCVGCDNPFLGNTVPATKTFHQVPPVRIWLVSVPYRANASSPTFTPSQFDVDMLASWLRRAYPTAEVIDTRATMPVQNELPEIKDNPDTPTVNEFREGFVCGDINSRLNTFVSAMPAEPPRTRYYGIVDDGDGFMRGCAGIGGRFGSGPSGGTPGSAAFGWDTDGSYTDWYGGHEIGHMYDRRHPGQCTESDDDDNYPFPPNGHIGAFGAGSDFQGFDAGNAALGPSMQLLDWRDGWADVMTYCKNQWISSYTHKGILNNLCNGEPQNCPNRPQLTQTRAKRATFAAAKGSRPRLAVNGSINLKKKTADLEQISAIRGLRLTERPKRSVYAVELLGRGGKRLKSYPFEPKELSDQRTGRREAMIDEVVKFDKATRRIEIVADGKALASQAVSANPPTVKVKKPKRGARLTDSLKVKWTGEDSDGDRLTYSLLYAADGKSYAPVAAGLRKRSYRVNLTLLGGGHKAAFKVIANDGVLTASARAKRLKVPAKAPHVAIAAPASGAKAVEGDSIQFIANVIDLQDARFEAGQIVWRSSLEGELGRGLTINRGLTAGVHEVTVTATNSAGRSSSRKVTVEVAAVPPQVDAQLIGP